MNPIVTQFTDISDGSQGPGADLGNQLLTKDYMMSVYPNLMPWMKIPALWMCGYNANGQLGDGTINIKNSPVQTIAGGTNWKQVACAAGGNFTAAIKTDGTLWTWGGNDGGQLGDGTTVGRSSPGMVGTSGVWAQVAAGTRYTAAIKTDGTLWMCGYNVYGQLGDGYSGVFANQSSPVQTIAGGTDWKQVSCGYRHAGAVKTDGALWLWGYNVYGQLGDNTTNSNSSPIQTIAGGTNWTSIACGGLHSAGIKTDGTMWTWGWDTYGQLGDNTTNSNSSPIQTIAGGTNWNQVSCGYYHTAAIKTDGTLWSWGNNVDGQLGNGDIISQSSPIQTIAGGTNWKSVTCGYHHTAAIKTDGTVWIWGGNTQGQLGIGVDGYTTSVSSPVQTVAGGNNWKSVSCGYNTTAAISECGKW